MKISFVSAVVGVLLAFPAAAQTDAAQPAVQSEWQGPLPVENERPFQAIFLHMPAQNPDVLARGATRLGIQLDIANDLLIPFNGPNGASVTEDFETQRLKVSWSKGFGRDMEYGIGANLTARNGGFLDSTVEVVHKLFNTRGDGFSSPVGRNNLPRGRSILAFQNAAGQGINEGSAFGLGDTKLWLKETTFAESKVFQRGNCRFETADWQRRAHYR